MELCPKTMKKWSENGVCGEFCVFGKNGEKREMGGRRWMVMVERCCGGVGNDGVVWMWWLNVFGGRKTEMEGEKGYTAG
jgi:hypothetical protein